MKKVVFQLILLFSIIQVSSAHPPKGEHSPGQSQVIFRADCQPGTSKMDLDINNVRARLLSSGDMWWNLDNPGYEIPKNSGISSIYAGAIWVGGMDGAGNLKLATAYFSPTAFYPGPLSPTTGTTNPMTCQNWDRHFVVFGAEIRQFREAYSLAEQNGTTLSPDQIPDNLKSYPARGNPYFSSMPQGFMLPDQDLAPFFDNKEDGIYDPLDGDYPILDTRGCNTSFADQMIYQIFNDNGGTPTTTSSAPNMEFQLQSYAFATNDELNDMTFYNYKMNYRSQDSIFDTYFSIWLDGDLGCGDDDYVGCDTTRNLAYYYNSDNIDGESDGSCSSGHPTYGDKIPMLGIDFLSLPIGQSGDELKMSSFIYYNNGTGPSGTRDPQTGIEVYHLMKGLWKDGSPLYGCDDGYMHPLCPVTKFAFPDAPDAPNGWSMAQAEITPGDRRTVQSIGPMTFSTGQTNRLSIGLPWVPDVQHPAPSLAKLLAADDKAQTLFDDCFEDIATNVQSPIAPELTLFPNPASDYIRIKIADNTSKIHLELINMAGQVLLSQNINTQYKTGVSHLPQGLYAYRIRDLKGKLIKSGKLTIVR